MRSRKQLPLEALQPYLFKVPEAVQLLDGPSIFDNPHPMEVEIGCGKGAFLLDQAMKHPERNFLGIEIDLGLQLYIATRIAKRSLQNIRLVRDDARRFVREYLASDSVAAIHIYFPDPWWKQRHRKRRVFTEGLAQQCERVLIPEGRFYFATDVEEYFVVMQRTVATHTRLQPTAEAPPLDVETNFARKAQAQARSIWRITYQKTIRQAAATEGISGLSTRTT